MVRHKSHHCHVPPLTRGAQFELATWLVSKASLLGVYNFSLYRSDLHGTGGVKHYYLQFSLLQALLGHTMSIREWQAFQIE